jgi:hypothetical protein
MEISAMAKTYTPTIKEITEKLKKMGFHKVTGKPKLQIAQYSESRKNSPPLLKNQNLLTG